MPQRHITDTYFGELVLLNMKTGDSVADNIRYDILKGISARLRTYNRKGREKYGFASSYSFPIEDNKTEHINQIQADTGIPVDEIVFTKYGNVDGTTWAEGRLGITNHYHFELVEDVDTGIDYEQPFVNHAGVVKQVVGSYLSGNILILQVQAPFQSVELFNTGYDVLNPSTHTGYYAEYTSGNDGYRYTYYSENAVFIPDSGATINAEVMPIIPFQDNFNGERPYGTLPWELDDYYFKEKMVGILGLDFFDSTLQVFPVVPDLGSEEWNLGYGRAHAETEELRNRFGSETEFHDYLRGEVDIPAFGTTEWDADYGSTFKRMKRDCANPNVEVPDATQTVCDDYETEEDYYNSIVEDKEAAAENNANITDVHFGFFASAKLLDEANVNALYYTLLGILPHMKRSEGTNGSFYKMSFEAGSFKVDYTFKEWSVCRRYGIANEARFPVGGDREPKYRHSYFTIDDTNDDIPDWDSGERGYYEHERAPYPVEMPPVEEGGGLDFSSFITPGYIELRVQERPEEGTGRQSYLEMRLIGPYAEHFVDVLKDGKYGRPGAVTIKGGLYNFYSDDAENPYSDVLLYPLNYEAMEKVPFFMKERLMRETMMFNVGAIEMQKLKWYQSTWFKVVMIIVALVISYFYPPFALTGFQNVLLTAVTMTVLQIAALFIDNPILRAVVQLAALYYGQVASTGSFSFNPAMIVEATGTALNAALAMKFQKLQEEMEEWRKTYQEQLEEFKEMEKSVGNGNIDGEFMLYLASLTPPGETPEDFFSRTLSSEVPSTDLAATLDLTLKLPNEK